MTYVVLEKDMECGTYMSSEPFMELFVLLALNKIWADPAWKMRTSDLISMCSVN